MNYKIFKLRFKTEFHFGVTTLHSSEYTFDADTLFSALFIESIKLGKSEVFLNSVKQNNIIFSDSFPFCESELFLPKPMLGVNHILERNLRSSVIKKAFKKLKYIPVEKFRDYLSGDIDVLNLPKIEQYIGKNMQVLAKVKYEDDALPYRVLSCSFKDKAGLYVIVQYSSESDLNLFNELFTSLSYSGIGGKRSSGKGRFEYFVNDCNKILEQYLTKSNCKRYMTLSISLPKENEIEEALNGSCYTVVKRCGFVYSDSYANQFLRKNDLYMIKSGSCVNTNYEGDIYDVSANKGSHPVYRYGKSLFIGLDL